MSRIKRTTEVLLLTVLATSAGCGDGASGPTQATEPCLPAVTLEPPSSGALAAVDRLEVVAITPEGCAPLEGPLAAFNWFSFSDRGSYLAYGARVTQILARRGTPILATGEHSATIEAPPGAPSAGGSYVHEEFALPLYPSAAGFMDMIASPEFQAIVSLQQAGARQEDYVFGFQKCIVGCESDGTAVATDSAPLLLHIFRFEGDDLEGAIRRVASSGDAPEVVYGGRLVARFQAIVGGVDVNSQNAPWGEGVMLFRVDSEAAARAWVESGAFRAFRQDTAEDVLVLLGSGLSDELGE